jgi:hypothetical protein
MLGDGSLGREQVARDGIESASAMSYLIRVSRSANTGPGSAPVLLVPFGRHSLTLVVSADVREWLFRRRALATAESRLMASQGGAELAERAVLTLELGERAHEPSEPFASGADVALACELYRESAYWSLAALNGGLGGGRSLAELRGAAPRELLLEIAGDETRLSRIGSRLDQPSFVDYAALPPAERAEAAVELRDFARGTVREASAPAAALRRARSERRWRLGLTLLIVSLALVVVVPRTFDRVTPINDLAAGKPWRASSQAMHCEPRQRRCGDHVGTRIFFHTENEPSPWVEIDLGSQQMISSVQVQNRSDCCRERALPLVVELSTDRERWHEVQRRTTNFRSWTAKFAVQEARWVRLRVDRTSILHLERVSVFR